MTNKIKKDLSEIYRTLHKCKMSGGLIGLLDSKLLNRLKYSVEDVERVLFAEVEPPKRKVATPKPTLPKLQTEEEVYEFYTNHLSSMFKATTSTAEADAILKPIGLPYLKHLYSIIINIPLKSKVTKKDIAGKIKDYFESKERTRDLSKTLV